MATLSSQLLKALRAIDIEISSGRRQQYSARSWHALLRCGAIVDVEDSVEGRIRRSHTEITAAGREALGRTP